MVHKLKFYHVLKLLEDLRAATLTSYAHGRERSALAHERRCLGRNIAQKSYFGGPNMQKLATTLITNIMYI